MSREPCRYLSTSYKSLWLTILVCAHNKYIWDYLLNGLVDTWGLFKCLSYYFTMLTHFPWHLASYISLYQISRFSKLLNTFTLHLFFPQNRQCFSKGPSYFILWIDMNIWDLPGSVHFYNLTWYYQSFWFIYKKYTEFLISSFQIKVFWNGYYSFEY